MRALLPCLAVASVALGAVIHRDGGAVTEASSPLQREGESSKATAYPDSNFAGTAHYYTNGQLDSALCSTLPYTPHSSILGASISSVRKNVNDECFGYSVRCNKGFMSRNAPDGQNERRTNDIERNRILIGYQDAPDPYDWSAFQIDFFSEPLLRGTRYYLNYELAVTRKCFDFPFSKCQILDHADITVWHITAQSGQTEWLDITHGGRDGKTNFDGRLRSFWCSGWTEGIPAKQSDSVINRSPAKLGREEHLLELYEHVDFQGDVQYLGFGAAYDRKCHRFNGKGSSIKMYNGDASNGKPIPYECWAWNSPDCKKYGSATKAMQLPFPGTSWRTLALNDEIRGIQCHIRKAFAGVERKQTAAIGARETKGIEKGELFIGDQMLSSPQTIDTIDTSVSTVEIHTDREIANWQGPPLRGSLEWRPVG
ncbi:hypothetical protein BU23DRAFT_571994 [Bimuria novae-zelandiae CBS 107.79]|uniref:Uncharacterized protein n=1 Tax=Bimuria novae-zelandiae CBS 107.79 TaxID=1447943 RepID=A0A6A5UV94_9PLEO|nr:hypothetical protein BU23DRAFT_571994 [Bimuria novae-zelandiae CBS 107.79]